MGDEIATQGVQTDTTDSADAGAVDTAATDTVLTGDAGTEGTSADSTDNSDADASASADGSDTSDANQSDSDTGEEGSQTPPDTYADFDLPEGMELDETALSEANPMFKELGLTQGQAQKVIDLYAKQVQASSEMQVDNFNQLMSDWRTQSQNDNEFGGNKFNESVKVAQNAISKYGTPELKQLLEDHGVGNHPEVVRFMVRVGHTLKEDVPGATGVAPTKAEDRVSLLYPNSNDS